MEYALIDSDSYEKCFEEADEIVSDASHYYNISKTDVRYQHIINYLNRTVPPFDIACFANHPSALQSNSNYSELTRFNWLLGGSLGLDISCSKIRYEKPAFVNSVSGLTLFYENEPILLLNSSPNQSWNHVIFTIIHEMVHIHKAKSNATYEKAAALIGNYKASQTAYPESLQPLENQTNVMASLLYMPSISFQDNLLTQSFSDLCITYTTSWAAMHNRIFNYLFYERGWDKYSAKNAVFAFRNSDLQEIEQVRDKLINTNSFNDLLTLPF